jgi:hypothetical protein
MFSLYSHIWDLKGLYYKILRIRNVWKSEKFRSKLMFLRLGKHTRLYLRTSLLWSPYITDPLCF